MENIEKKIDSQKMLNLISDLVFFKDLNGFYKHANDSYLKFHGFKKEDILNKNDYDLFDKKTAEEFLKTDTEVIKSKKDLIFEEKLTNKNNNYVFFETKKTLVYDEEQKAIGVLGIARDISIRKEYEILYEEHQDVLERIIKGENILDVLKYIIFLCESKSENMICSILLLDEKKERFVDGIAPNLPKFYNDAINGLEIGDGVGSCGTAAYNKKRVIITNIDEHPFWEPFLEYTKKANLHACWSQPIYSKDEEVLGTFAIYYNQPKEPSSFELKIIDSYAYLCGIAIQKRNDEKKLEEQRAMLIQQSKMASLGEMMENIAHQWRQPLSLISTGASAIQLQQELDIFDESISNEATNSILEASKYLTKTIDDFKDFFVQEKEKNSFYIQNVIDRVLLLTTSKFKNDEINFVFDVQNHKIKNYENELIQVIINILNNARDALKEKNIKDKYIFINTYKVNNNIKIEIKDNANGIEENIIPKIFEPYFTTKHKSQGTGIGLYMSQEIITKHFNGILSVNNKTFKYKNNIYKGAVFNIEFPI